MNKIKISYTNKDGTKTGQYIVDEYGLECFKEFMYYRIQYFPEEPWEHKIQAAVYSYPDVKEIMSANDKKVNSDFLINNIDQFIEILDNAREGCREIQSMSRRNFAEAALVALVEETRTALYAFARNDIARAYEQEPCA